jgi:hypothetical protein
MASELETRDKRCGKAVTCLRLRQLTLPPNEAVGHLVLAKSVRLGYRGGHSNDLQCSSVEALVDTRRLAVEAGSSSQPGQ